MFGLSMMLLVHIGHHMICTPCLATFIIDRMMNTFAIRIHVQYDTSLIEHYKDPHTCTVWLKTLQSFVLLYTVRHIYHMVWLNRIVNKTDPRSLQKEGAVDEGRASMMLATKSRKIVRYHSTTKMRWKNLMVRAYKEWLKQIPDGRRPRKQHGL